jgi:hypothetical protein
MSPTTRNRNTGTEEAEGMTSFFFFFFFLLIIKKNRIGSRRKEEGKEERRKESKEHISSHPIPLPKTIILFLILIYLFVQ